MAYKIFEAPNGDKWEVWLVVPTDAERRKGERRVARGSPALSYSGPERRTGGDRRTRVSGGRTVLSPDLVSGWLCFESEPGEKRRLVPVPDGWDLATDEKLWAWCELAAVVTRCGPRREELGPER